MKCDYITLKYEETELLYDFLADKIWIDRKNLSILTKIKNITVSRRISSLLLENIINNKQNVKIYQKKNYKTTFLYDNKVIRILLNNDIEFKKILLFQKEEIKKYKIKMLGKIYFKNGNLILSDTLLNENDLSFTKDDILNLYNNMNITDKEKYDLNDVFSIGYIFNNKEFILWANNILKKVLIDGYYINNEKCFNEKNKIISITRIADNLINKDYSIDDDKSYYYKSLTKYNRELYDSKEFFYNKIQNAKYEIIILSKYIDNSIFDMLEKACVKIKIYSTDTLVLEDIYKRNFLKRHKLKLINNYKLDDTYIILDNVVYLIDTSIINLFKENNSWKIVNINVADLLSKAI